MAKEREFCCTIAAPSIINFENHCICQCNVNGHFPIRHWLTLQASDHIPRKCEIWKYVDYHMNIQSILTSNGFLDISIHIRSCGCDFWKYLLLFSHTNSPKLTGLPIFGQFAHIPRFHSNKSQGINEKVIFAKLKVSTDSFAKNSRKIKFCRYTVKRYAKCFIFKLFVGSEKEIM